MGGHVCVIGETQSGKTFYANKLQQRWPGMSIFYNTNEVPYVWGERVQTVAQIQRGVKKGTKKFVVVVPQTPKSAERKLREVQAFLYKYAPPGTPLWCQLIVDEAQKFPEVCEDLTRLSLGRGIQVVPVTQYPTGLPPGLRSNCPNRVIFKPGIEGTKFLRDYGQYPHEEITQWTQNQYHFASYAPARGWQYHKPI